MAHCGWHPGHPPVAPGVAARLPGSAEMMGCAREGWDRDPGNHRRESPGGDIAVPRCPGGTGTVDPGGMEPPERDAGVAPEGALKAIDGGTGDAAVPAVALGTRGVVPSHHPGHSLLLPLLILLILLLIPAESHKQPHKSRLPRGKSQTRILLKNTIPESLRGTLRVLPASPPPSLGPRRCRCVRR